jgi:hypothetical protein
MITDNDTDHLMKLSPVLAAFELFPQQPGDVKNQPFPHIERFFHL